MTRGEIVAEMGDAFVRRTLRDEEEGGLFYATNQGSIKVVSKEYQRSSIKGASKEYQRSIKGVVSKEYLKDHQSIKVSEDVAL